MLQRRNVNKLEGQVKGSSISSQSEDNKVKDEYMSEDDSCPQKIQKAVSQ